MKGGSAMLRTGRPAPDVDADDFHVSVTLAASRPNTAFITGLSRLRRRFGDAVVDNVNALVVLHHLVVAPLITLRQVRTQAQSTALEAQATMDWLGDVAVVQSVTERNDEWVLTSDARAALAGAVPEGVASVSVEDWVLERLKSGESLTNNEIAEATGADSRDVTSLLVYLRRAGRAMKDPDGSTRGSRVRWISPG